ncbi:MAG: hypothetical protein LBJ17_00880 [Dysgonamonadaceae bacterium]|nr:hypothetical protein [Dysgonamonadaceae bacterium]MDR1371669.1 hypothetical protein [Dysgonamonadaceae bacterium]
MKIRSKDNGIQTFKIIKS